MMRSHRVRREERHPKNFRQTGKGTHSHHPKNLRQTRKGTHVHATQNLRRNRKGTRSRVPKKTPRQRRHRSAEGELLGRLSPPPNLPLNHSQSQSRKEPPTKAPSSSPRRRPQFIPGGRARVHACQKNAKPKALPLCRRRAFGKLFTAANPATKRTPMAIPQRTTNKAPSSSPQRRPQFIHRRKGTRSRVPKNATSKALPPLPKARF